MSHNWLIVANSSHARIFRVTSIVGKPRELKLLHELQHPQSRMKRQELLSDKPGVYRANSLAGSGHPQDVDPKQVEMERFAKELAELIDQARTLNRFEQLIIVAPPQFYGVLEHHLSGSIKHLIKKAIQKDYTAVIERDLQRLVFSRTKEISP
ncbi:MAG: uncharacterized protein K0S29_1395 [Gammaproteobacteria bacterium]|jgi:protein required for attachment to host cells|nr:uncharacterized protein [Gammaproteobacteria bacterium]